MEKLLHIIATPRGGQSRTLKVSQVFQEELKTRFPEMKITELNLFEETPPELTLKTVNGKYVLLTGKDLSPEQKRDWGKIEKYINNFLAHDAYLISCPMWNFSIPYPLKNYIDVIVQPRYTFRYTDKGIEGLAKGKKMVVVTTRGGDYSPQSPAHAYDLQEPYLRTVFGL
ncbi:MAG: NAD(P)H-dependent oxidoreductase, partial [Candidatus Omnitrophica bacterium]|nr:NAD(P)H-dependent oxidoreductase [Candidatus Omnitrophota bacterium]